MPGRAWKSLPSDRAVIGHEQLARLKPCKHEVSLRAAFQISSRKGIWSSAPKVPSAIELLQMSRQPEAIALRPGQKDRSAASPIDRLEKPAINAFFFRWEINLDEGELTTIHSLEEPGKALDFLAFKRMQRP